MDDLWFYRALARFGVLNYRAKIMIAAFLGTHVPLIALIGWVAAGAMGTWSQVLGILGVALAATLIGTGATLFVLNHLLRPVLMTSRALRTYRETRATSALPTGFTDEVGTLMADAVTTMTHLEESLIRLEHFDAATGLPNGAWFIEEVRERLAAGHRLAVGAVAFDGHARIAETLDQDRAETATRELANRLEGVLGAEGALARVAADRFAFIADASEDAVHGWRETLERAQDLVMQCDAQIRLEGLALRPLLRAGIARSGEDADEAEALLDQALAAADQARDRSRVALYSPEARTAARERFQIEQDLRAALEGEQFELHYQPIVSLATGGAVGAEALIRWRHPERGLVPPGIFIPIAESSGLIEPIGRWVLDAACAQLAAWDAAGLDGLRVAVNVSAQQFADPGIVERVRAALASHAVAADRLELELTESAATNDHGHTRDLFGRLRDLGVRIAIDDFGTGFASLSQLRRLPFDKLKIDREFVTAVESRGGSQAICASLLALGQGLGIDVLAEGTETEAEIAWLHGRGCRLFQGYRFARPVPARDLAAAIAAPSLVETASRYRVLDTAA